MHHIGAEFEGLRSLVPNYVVVKLQIPIVAKREQRGVAHRRELAAKRDLWIPHIQRVRADAIDPGLRGKLVSGVGAGLTAGDGEKSETGFVQYIRAERMGPTGDSIEGVST